MEYQNITKLLDTTFPKVPRFITKKRIAVHDLSAGSYNINKQTRFKIPMLRSDLCDFSDAYIVVKRKFTANFNPRKVYANNDFPDELFPNNIFPGWSTDEQINTARAAAKKAVVSDANKNDIRDLIKAISFRNNARFIGCISQINSVLIDNAEDVYVVTLVYNLIESGRNYSKTSGSLSNYYRDEPTNDDDEINHYLKSKSFDYTSSVIEKLVNINNDNQADRDDIKIVVPLKHLSMLNILLINCEIHLILTGSKDCLILRKAKRYAVAATRLSATNFSKVLSELDVSATNATFKITDTKLYV